MKRIRLCVLIFGVTFTIGLNSISCKGESFHKGGVGNCDGCHTTPPALKYSDASSTCLECHQAPIGSSLPKDPYVLTDTRVAYLCTQLSPGGDFCWLKKSYRWYSTGTGTQEELSSGERHGHNIIALDFGYEADSTNKSAPGGNYPADALSCISCHDPHGNYRRFADGSIGTAGLPIVASGSYADSPSPGNGSAVGVYRLLGGKSYKPTSVSALFAFTADPPAAVSPSPYNRAETFSDTRVAYGRGFSEWCANCHKRIHNDDSHGSGRHPAGNDARLPPEIINHYNSYVASGNLKGNPATSYSSLVPFEMGTNDYALLKMTANSNGSDRSGPQGTANVMCLTCHRAHASGWDSMLRWNMAAEFIVYEGHYPGNDNATPEEYAQGRTEAETRKTFYDRPAGSFASFQRSLCNKCHRKD